MKQRKPLQRKKSLRAQSPKRAIEARKYTALRAAFFVEHPTCQAGYPEICKWRSSQVHHKCGRGRLLNEVEHWMAICLPCHNEIHRHPKEARRLGFILNPRTL